MSTLNTTEFESELVLLLQCARHHLDGGYQHHIQQLVKHPELDWSKVLELASFHRLLPILCKVLSSNASIDLPSPIVKALYRYQLKNISRNFFLLQELRSFLKILEAHNISAITFKGPMTAMSAYGDLSLRMFTDLDLLVHPDNFLQVRDIAIRHGYQCDKFMAVAERECLSQLTDQEQNAYFLSEKEYCLLDASSHTFLDIHQGILSKQFAPLFDTRWIWNHTQMVTLGGYQVLGLTPEVQILVLVAQGAEDYWHQLGKIFDVAMLIDSHPTLDWNALIELSETLDILPRLVLSLNLVQSLYGVTLPDCVQRKIEAVPSIKALAQKVQTNLLLNKQGPADIRLTMGLVMYQLQLMNNWKNRVRYLLTLMSPTLADIAAVPLPKPLFFIYYLFRPLRLIQGIVWH